MATRPLRPNRMQELINQDAARIFRIVHRDNIDWLLRNGIHCRNSNCFCENYINIGDPDLIAKRNVRSVEKPPGGTLNDYVPFYFTPFSPMAYNIRTGFRGIKRRANSEIVFLQSSVERVAEAGPQFLFTNGHAYMQTTKYFANITSLKYIDWPLLQSRDFRHDPNDLGKSDRYQAEFLVYRHLPVDALDQVVCYDSQTRCAVSTIVDTIGLNLDVVTKPELYF